jgi:capsular exopolysaccharide synthesis family protein
MIDPQEGPTQPMAPTPPPQTLVPAPDAQRNGRSALAPVGSPRLVMLLEPTSAAAEAYRNLSASLQFADPARPLRSLAVTSAGKREDKASTVANLAVAMAEGGRRVVVVDADLRHPELHALFGVANQQGLTTAVLGTEDDVPLVDTSVPGLRLLPGGPTVANPVEVLGAPRLERLLDQLREEADMVLVNVAPAAVLADAAVVAPRTDGVLLVVTVGRTRRDLAQRAKEQLQRVNAHILGVVLTGARADKGLYEA